MRYSIHGGMIATVTIIASAVLQPRRPVWGALAIGEWQKSKGESA